jgi:hypothetical protein
MSIDESEELRAARVKIETMALRESERKFSSQRTKELKAELSLEKERKKLPKEGGYKSLKETIKAQEQKQRAAYFKKQAIKQLRLRKLGILAPIASTASELQSQISESQKREGIIRELGSKAERIERQITGFNEVGFLNNLESARMKALTISNGWLQNQEKSITDSFPD